MQCKVRTIGVWRYVTGSRKVGEEEAHVVDLEIWRREQ
jgi:hypothetical protein